ncbi:MAG: alpha-glucosidase C-terminal domain-containing protein, partial [Anaerolineales bacterium]|nr:alpha-glucosidase C-terminal domain-containing protein [Anaerolineales bacterium]
SASTQAIKCLVPQWQDGVLHDLLTDAQIPVDGGGFAMTLAPYQYLWLAR